MEWSGKVVNINNTKYIYRKMTDTLYEIYDLESYKRAVENPNVIPVQIGTLDIDKVTGKSEFKKIVK